MLLPNKGKKIVIKICVLGNSHVGSLKTGWDRIFGQFPEYELTFFAARSNNLRHLVISNGALVPQNEELEKSIAFTSGGLKLVKLDFYDAFVIYGLGLLIPKIDSRISSAVLNIACREKYLNCLNLKLAKKIRAAVNSNIYIGHIPQEASNIDCETASPAQNINYNLIFEKMKKFLDIPKTILIQQPSKTFSNCWNTKLEYSTGSSKLNVGDLASEQLHPETDHKHMNGNFGELWLRALFDQMADSSSKRNALE